MSLPFTAEQFFQVFARYNTAVWPAQLALLALAATAVRLALRPGWRTSRLISWLLVGLWTWMAIAYHFAFFSAINPAAWGFGALFLAGAATFAWNGVVRQRLRFGWPGDAWSWIGLGLIAYALLVYPAIGYALGHRFPAAPVFGLPCPTTIFTLGMLLLTLEPVPRQVFAVPLLWSAIGSAAAFRLGVPEDYGLLAAGLIGLAAIGLRPRAGSGVAVRGRPA